MNDTMRTLFILILAGLLSACTQNGDKENSDPSTMQSKAKEGIELSTEQKERAEIATGEIEQRTLSDVVFCTGKLTALPQNKANVSPSMGGFIQKLFFQTGEHVKQGDVLATFHHPDFFGLQQQYMEAKAQKDYYYEEYKRQGELTVENAASMKTMQQAKADYLSAEANYKSLKAQLVLLGIDPEQTEQGDFAQTFTIKAPVSGIVTSVDGNTGLFIDAGTSVFEIVDDKQLYLVLSVLEKDLKKISYGQSIIFHTLNSDKTFETKIKRIGSSINEEERIVPVFATINNTDQLLKTGMFVKAQILTAEKLVYAIPEEAVFENESETMVFIKKKGRYVKIPVQKGWIKDGWCEIMEPDPQLLNHPIVIKGGYYLQSVQEIIE